LDGRHGNAKSFLTARRSTLGTAVVNLVHHRSAFLPSLGSPLQMIVLACSAAILTSSTMVHAATSRHSNRAFIRTHAQVDPWLRLIALFSFTLDDLQRGHGVLTSPSYSVLQTGACEACRTVTGNQSAPPCYTTDDASQLLTGCLIAFPSSSAAKILDCFKLSLQVIRGLRGMTW